MHNPSIMYTLTHWWDHVKCGFGGMCCEDLDIPRKLAHAWKAYKKIGNSIKHSYDRITFFVVDIF